jgi:hypothetical protein
MTFAKHAFPRDQDMELQLIARLLLSFRIENGSQVEKTAQSVGV